MDLEQVVELEVDLETTSDGLEVEIEKTTPRGLSAYEVAKENGYTGTETQWLASLKGDSGQKGETGATGPAGQNGANGVDGVSPIATVTQTTTGATVSITDKNGTTSANLTNGKDGKDGKDGETYTLPIASDTTLGGVKIGENLEIDGDGVLNATGGSNDGLQFLGYFEDYQTSATAFNFTNYLGDGYLLSKGTNTFYMALDYEEKTYTLQFDISKEASSISKDLPIYVKKYVTKEEYEASVINAYSLTYIIAPSSLNGYKSGVYTKTFRIDKDLNRFVSGGSSATAYIDVLDKAQTIKAVKTFTKLPETSITPTTDNQMVNKKYVDDAITTALGTIETELSEV